MVRGRAPCCDKIGLKKGPWTPAEDLTLITFIQNYGHGNWRALPKQAGLLRCGKSCRLRWTNYLRPDIKRGNFTQEEEETIIKLHELLGNKWSKIASHLRGRTDNEIKNVWNTHLKKRLAPKIPNIPCSNEGKESSISSSSASTDSSISYCNEGKGIEHGKQACPMVVSGPAGEVVQNEPMVDVSDVSDDRYDHEKHFDWRLVSNGTNPSPDDDRKELSSSYSSTTCSSNESHSKEIDHVEGPADQEEHQQFKPEFERPSEVHDRVEEVNKQDTNEKILEIPFEPNLDFWDMFDNDPCFVTSNMAPVCDFEAHQHSTLQEENESRKWVTYLENELGLQATSEDNQEFLTKDVLEPLVESDIDPVGIYFQLWPFSHHNSSM